jgi:hypothetical protein
MNSHEKGGVAIGNTKVGVLVTGEQTSSRYAITESTYGPGTGVGPHRPLSFSEINIVAKVSSKGRLMGSRLAQIQETWLEYRRVLRIT